MSAVTTTRTVDIPAAEIGTCPACGRDVAATTPLKLPAEAGSNPGGCIIPAEAGDHFGLDVHPDFRPDVIVITHE